jgi:DNA-binding NtrC family response regulator
MLRPCAFAMASSKDGILEKPIVLVVENESVIRMETVQMIKDAGYAVLDASNTSEAMKILKGRRDIRAVFTEIRLPGHQNGMELGRVIAGRWPLVRLIMTSGVPKTDDFPTDWRYVPKPYDSAQIAAVLRAVIVPHLTVVR